MAHRVDSCYNVFTSSNELENTLEVPMTRTAFERLLEVKRDALLEAERIRRQNQPAQYQRATLVKIPSEGVIVLRKHFSS